MLSKNRKERGERAQTLRPPKTVHEHIFMVDSLQLLNQMI